MPSAFGVHRSIERVGRAMLVAMLLCALSVAGSRAEEQTLYEILGVDEKASPAQIRSAYRKLALSLHPDKTGGEAGWSDTTARFIKVSEAYETLSNGRKRAAYDAKLRSSSWLSLLRRTRRFGGLRRARSSLSPGPPPSA